MTLFCLLTTNACSTTIVKPDKTPGFIGPVNKIQDAKTEEEQLNISDIENNPTENIVKSDEIPDQGNKEPAESEQQAPDEQEPDNSKQESSDEKEPDNSAQEPSDEYNPYVQDADGYPIAIFFYRFLFEGIRLHDDYTLCSSTHNIGGHIIKSGYIAEKPDIGYFVCRGASKITGNEGAEPGVFEFPGEGYLVITDNDPEKHLTFLRSRSDKFFVFDFSEDENVKYTIFEDEDEVQEVYPGSWNFEIFTEFSEFENYSDFYEIDSLGKNVRSFDEIQPIKLLKDLNKFVFTTVGSANHRIGDVSSAVITGHLADHPDTGVAIFIHKSFYYYRTGIVKQTYSPPICWVGAITFIHDVGNITLTEPGSEVSYLFETESGKHGRIDYSGNYEFID